ncbi:hypothetical protein [Streptomyces sp. NPDC002758]
MTAKKPNLLVHPDATVNGDGIWFASPPGFIALPLNVLAAESSPQMVSTAVAPVLASAPDEMTHQRLVAALATVQQMIQALRVERTVHCSLGLHRDDTRDRGGVLTSVFTINWVATSWAPRGVKAARALTTAEGHTDIAFAELPCGPAAFSETLRSPRSDSGLPQERLLQIYAHLPHPDGRSLALLTLSTNAVAHRSHYRSLLRQIAELASFDDPFARPEDGEKSR